MLGMLALTGCSGCTTVGYYAQAINGHFDLMQKRQSLSKLMTSENTDPELKRKLGLLRDAREYAVSELQLPDNDSYSTYVETGKRYVTWNVVATQEFSMQPKTWCFPVAGCVSYRGYFAEEDAESYRQELIQQGFDTQLGGASAYSTLGWFEDPLLDTMLRGSDIRLVSLLFHELAHQVVYVKDDSSFNEAFASFVEQEGARLWLESNGDTDKIPGYNAFLKRQIDFNQLLQDTRVNLVKLYKQDLPDEQKRERKKAVFDTMRDNYAQLKEQEWEGYTGYDNWFARPMNNARLVSVATYRKWIPAYAALFEEQGRDFSAFFERVTELSKMDFAERQQLLQGYLDR